MLRGVSSTDHMAYRLTRGQGLFVLNEHSHVSPLHILAQNISASSVVLEYPTFDQFINELNNNYGYIAISFKAIDSDQLLEMCKLIRKYSPRSQIVVGGYGAVCSPELFKGSEWENKIDHLCLGEGISFLRQLLGESEIDCVHCCLPKEGSTLPWITPRSVGTKGVILSGIGCTYRCPFCSTSEYTKGKYIEVMNAEQIYKTMCNYWKDPFTNSVSIYDENFLKQTEKVNSLGEYLRNDQDYGLARLNYSAFGSLNTIPQYNPEQLLLNGIDMIWIGVESKYSGLKKLNNSSAQEIFQMLHSIGIKTIGSWIMGDDGQTPDNIKNDIDYFINLDPTFQQISLLSILPSMPIWHELKQRGRIPEEVKASNYHLYGNTFIHPNFTYEEMLGYIKNMYNRIYLENGPAIMKILEVNLNGYEFCNRSNEFLLKQVKSQYFHQRCESYSHLIKTALTFAPSDQVRKRIESLRLRFQDIFGKPTLSYINLSDLILRKAEQEIKRRDKGIYKTIEEPFRRYCYPEINNRNGNKPYVVEYPEGDKFEFKKAG